MYDVANMKYINYLLARSDAVEKRNSEKAAVVKRAGGETGQENSKFARRRRNF